MKDPRVTIGIPVYNGEKYLARAIESVLAQSYRDFELIISDNASTDRTQKICQAYAAKDPRIRYYRNEQNLGASANFNRLFDELARGEYFQWLAHDDCLAPDFIAQCVSVLEDNPSAILCFSWVRVIGEDDEQVATCELALRIDAPEPRVRFRDVLLEWHNSFYVFGLIRASALRQTKLILPYAHGDTVLIARLSLLGRFHQVSDYLFLSRNHPEQSNRVYKANLPRGLDLAAYASWYDTRTAQTLRYPYWRLMAEFYATLWDIELGLVDRAACHFALARKALRYGHGLLWDLGGLPRALVRLAASMKQKNYDGRQIAESR